nr:MAG TPA: hypothetical protein [Caudoviricetes sp.]
MVQLIGRVWLIKCTSHFSICKGTNKSVYMQIY